VSFLHSQPPGEAESSRNKWVLAVVIGGVALLGLALTAYFVLRDGPAPETPRAVSAPKVSGPPESKAPPASPVPTDRASTGSLEVTSDVEGATVYLDDQRVGATPYQEEQLAPGRYDVRVEQEGYRPFREEVRVGAGRRARVEARLAPASPVLRVSSDVPGASVFVDRRYLGTTPLETRDLSAGSHQITVSADGYDMYAEAIELGSAALDVNVRFKEVKLDEAVGVVHKHRMGSCSGQLRATAAGLRYESSDPKDTFNAPFANLAEFKVDYLQKNLRVKLKGGRTYNFTEPTGNADGLYVFHQKVESATKQ